MRKIFTFILMVMFLVVLVSCTIFDHKHFFTEVPGKEATCTEDGTEGYFYCKGCGLYFKDKEGTQLIINKDDLGKAIPALGHDYQFVGFEWSEDLSSAKAKYACSRDASHTKEEAATVTVTTVPATCEEKGKTIYVAAVEGQFEEKVVESDALDHDYQFKSFKWAEDNKSAQVELVCSRDNSHTKLVDATMSSAVKSEATYEAAKVVTYTATYGTHTESKDVTEGEPLVHTHAYEFKEFKWTQDEETKAWSAKVVLECKVDGCKETLKEEDVEVVVTEVAKTEDAPAKKVYTATYQEHSEAKEVEIEEVLPEKGTLENPYTVEEALAAFANLEAGSFSESKVYVKGLVASIGQKGNYYKNVYLVSEKGSETQMLIYTINMGEGIEGFDVDYEIVAYGYFKNYNGTIEMAGNGSDYVYAVSAKAPEGVHQHAYEFKAFEWTQDVETKAWSAKVVLECKADGCEQPEKKEDLQVSVELVPATEDAPAKKVYTATYGEHSESKEVEVSGDEPVTGSATMTAGTNGSAAVVNEQPAIKVGTSKNAGNMTLTVPAGATKLTMYVAAWNNAAGNISVTVGSQDAQELDILADSGISNNSPFTLAGDEETFKVEIILGGLTEETTITLASGTANRFVVWNATYSDEAVTPQPQHEHAYQFVEYVWTVDNSAEFGWKLEAKLHCGVDECPLPDKLVELTVSKDEEQSVEPQVGVAGKLVLFGQYENEDKAEKSIDLEALPEPPAYTAEVTIDLTAQNYTNGELVEEVTVDPITATFAKGTGNNDPKYYDTGTAVRLYGGNTLTLSGATIVKVEFTFASGEGSNTISVNSGKLEGTVWTGSSSELVFTIDGTSGHRRVQSMKVTYATEGPQPQHEHNYQFVEYVWTEDQDAELGWKAEAKYECVVDGCNDNDKVKLYPATVAEDLEQYVAPTATTEGKKVLTATYENEKVGYKDIVLPATGEQPHEHNYSTDKGYTYEDGKVYHVTECECEEQNKEEIAFSTIASLDDAKDDDIIAVKLVVLSITNTNYGNALLIDENNNQLTLYGSNYKDLEQKFVSGDEIVVVGGYKLFGGNTKEIVNGTVLNVAHTERVINVTGEHVTWEGIPEVEMSGSEVTFTLQVTEGYKINSVTLNESTVLSALEDGSYKFTVGALNEIAIVTSEEGQVTALPVSFKLGEDGAASHADGSEEKVAFNKIEGTRTLTLTDFTKLYKGARDAAGNGAIKLGTSSATGGFTFTVDDDVNYVIIRVASYKANNTSVKINGETIVVTAKSNDGQSQEILINTTTNKTITLVSGAANDKRLMVYSIDWLSEDPSSHTHSYQFVEEVPSTCEEQGMAAHYECDGCDLLFLLENNEYKEVKEEDLLLPLAAHKYGEPEWEWDGYESAEATFTCEECEDMEFVEGEAVEDEEQYEAPTETTKGQKVWVVTVSFGGKEYSTSKVQVLAELAHQHSYQYEVRWDDDNKAYLVGVCACEEETEPQELQVTSETLDPTCDEEGLTIYTATLPEGIQLAQGKTNTKEVELPALGHSYMLLADFDGVTTETQKVEALLVCVREDCEYDLEVEATLTYKVTKEATKEEKGTRLYTATYQLDETHVLTDTYEEEFDYVAPKGSEENPFTLAEAMEVILATGQTATTETYYVRGLISEFVKKGTSGDLQFKMSDGTNEILVYYAHPNGCKEEYVTAGYTIVVSGKLVNYQGKTPEMTSGSNIEKLELPFFEVSLAENENGSVVKSNEQLDLSKVELGDIVEFTITPEEGYKFVSIVAKDNENKEYQLTVTDNKATLKVEANVTVSAVFEELPSTVSITLTAGDHAELSALDQQLDLSAVELNADVEFQAVAANGWKLLKVLVNGVEKEFDAEGKFTVKASEDLVITLVIDEITQHTITLVENNKVEVTGLPEGKANKYSTVTFDVEVKDNAYELVKVLLDDEELTATEGHYSFEVSEDHEIEVVLKDKCVDLQEATVQTLSFSSTDNRLNLSTTQQVWQQNGITFTNYKANSSTNVADYSNPVRLYKGSIIVIAFNNMSKIEFTCNTGKDYASALIAGQSFENALVTILSNKVTITFITPVNSFTFNGLSDQVRLNSLKVYTEESMTVNHGNMIHTEAKEATCMEKGNVEYWTCEVCGRHYADEEGKQLLETVETPINPKNHDYEIEYEWLEENTQVKATASCKHCDDFVVEASIVSVEITEATCEQAGKNVLTATFTNDLFETQSKEEVISATGHKYGDPVYEWNSDNTKVTATRYCEHDNKHLETETVDATKTSHVDSTCEGKGKDVFTSAEFSNKAFAVQTKEVELAVLGHDWNEVTYVWNEDNTKATATRTCKNNLEHVETETVDANLEIINPTCTEDGKKVYTAEFVNVAFTKQTKEVVLDKHHTLEYHQLVEASNEADGTKAYYECSVCHKLFWDKESQEEVDEEELVIKQYAGSRYKLLLNNQQIDLIKNNDSEYKYIALDVLKDQLLLVFDFARDEYMQLSMDSYSKGIYEDEGVILSSADQKLDIYIKLSNNQLYAEPSKSFGVVGNFNGWANDVVLECVDHDKHYVAKFFVENNGNLELKVRVNGLWDESYPTGNNVNYVLENAKKGYYTLTFWSDSKWIGLEYETYTITWLDENGEQLSQQVLNYGEMPSYQYSKEVADEDKDLICEYIITTDKEVVAAAANETYKFVVTPKEHNHVGTGIYELKEEKWYEKEVCACEHVHYALLEDQTSILASINTFGYKSTAAAIEAAKDNDTVKLEQDVDFCIYVSGKKLTLNLNGKKVTDTVNSGIYAANGAEVIITGNGSVEAQEAALLVLKGSKLTVQNGTYTSKDNFVVGTNGTKGWGENEITINGGTFNGNIQTKGYIACGVYVANDDKVALNAGTFNIHNGVGVVARSGNTTVNKDVVFNIESNGTIKAGKVGDANINIEEPKYLVLDLLANYPGGKPALENNTNYAVNALVADLDNMVLALNKADEITLYGDITYGGTLSFTKNTTLYLNGHKLESVNKVALAAREGAKLIIEGNGEVVAQEACVMAFNGSKLIINNGTFTSKDNFVVGTNGTQGWGENEITINGGTFNGYIETKGYIACGVYVANNDKVVLNAGTFNITNGVGVVARSGNTTVNKDVVFNIESDGTVKAGKVGDANINIEEPKYLVLDLLANYPGGKPELNNKSSYEIFVLKAFAPTEDGVSLQAEAEIPADTVLVSNEIKEKEQEEAYQNVISLVGENTETYAVYEIELQSGNQTVNAEGKFVVTLQLDLGNEEFNKINKIVHLHEGEEPQYIYEFSKDSNNKTITFEVSKFSKFAFAHEHSFGEWTNTLAPQCEVKGQDSRTCQLCGEVEHRDVNPTGHVYEFANWTWAEDLLHATVKFVCDNNNEHTLSYEVESTVEHTVLPTSNQKGLDTYTVVYEFDNIEYTDSKTKEVDKLTHEYVEKWSWELVNNEWTATLELTDTNDANYKENLNAKVTSVTTDPTCLEDGKIVYTAKVSNTEKEFSNDKVVKLDKLGHDFSVAQEQYILEDNVWKQVYKCSRCDETAKKELADQNSIVASINTFGYKSTAAAIEAAKDNDTVKLEQDVDFCIYVSGKKLTLNLNGKKVTDTVNCGIYAVNGADLIITGNGSVEAQEAALLVYKGSKLTVLNGTFTSKDNFVVGTNGSQGWGKNEITINGGTFNGGIQTKGYIACGVYVANDDKVVINAGEFNIYNGIGLLARSGNTTVNKDVVFDVTPGDVKEGKVGDANINIEEPKFLVIDLLAEYPGGKPALKNNTTYAVTALVKELADLVEQKELAQEIILYSDMQYNGTLSFEKDMHLDLNGHKLESLNNVALAVKGFVELVIDGNGEVVAQEACAMSFDGGTLIINDGTYTSKDNFVVGTNGTKGRGFNTIIISGGTFNGNIQTKGYIACGVYVANNDVVAINGGTFNIHNGVGVVARSGQTTIDSSVKFYITSDNTIKAGKVGDANINIEEPKYLVLDLLANYPGGRPELTNGSEYNVNALVNTLEDLNEQKALVEEVTLYGDFTYQEQLVISKDLILHLNGHKLESTNDVAIAVVNKAKLVINGEGNVVAQEACVMAFDGSKFEINGGTYTSKDNFVLGTNGTKGRGNNEIVVNGGTFNGNIKTNGYIACGVYVANNDKVAINGGTFNIYNGVGVVARAGQTSISDNVVFNFKEQNLEQGWVGDNKNLIPTNHEVVVDFLANYPGLDMLTFEMKTTKEIYTITNYTITWVVNGKVTKETYKTGEMPSYKGNDLVKESDNKDVCYYEFAGWDSELELVFGNKEYEAVFNGIAHTEEILKAVNPTCTETGLTEGKKCSHCGEILVAQQVVAALGHDWNEPTYVWNEDNTKVTATRTCKRNEEHFETEKVDVVFVLTEATNENAGSRLWTATFTNEAFEQQQKQEVIPAYQGSRYAVVARKGNEVRYIDVEYANNENGYQQYKSLHTALFEDEVLSALDKATATEFNFAIDGASTKDINHENGTILSTRTYDFYLKLKSGEDQLYIDSHHATLKGSFDNWGDGIEMVYNSQTNRYEAEVIYPLGLEYYHFKVFIDEKWYPEGNWNLDWTYGETYHPGYGKYLIVCDPSKDDKGIDAIDLYVTITWLDENGEQLDQQELKYGVMPSYNYVKAVDKNTVCYYQMSMNKEIAVATEDTTYQFVATPVLHNLEYHDYQAATCTEPGQLDYITCEKCNLMFAMPEDHYEVVDYIFGDQGLFANESLEEEYAVAGKVIAGNKLLPFGFNSDHAIGLGNIQGLQDGDLVVITGILGMNKAGDLISFETGATVEQIQFVESAELTIAAKGHKEEVLAAKASTCTETGLTEGKKCSVCGEILVAQQEVPALGHTELVLEAKAPTCTETGLTEGKKCSVCGEILVAQLEVPALGHNYGDWVVTQESTCEEKGSHYKECSRCHDQVVEEIDALGHDWSFTAANPATCEEAGNENYYECQNCHNKYVVAANQPTILATIFDDNWNKQSISNVTITGVVAEIVTEYNSQYDNTTVDIIPFGAAKTLRVFRVTGGSDIEIGDVIAVNGTIKYYEKDSIIEFDAGCTYSKDIKTTVVLPMLGHDYQLELTFEDEQAVVKYVCSHNSTHVINVEAEVTEDTSKYVAASCSSEGKKVYNITYTDLNDVEQNVEKEVVLSKTKHTDGDTELYLENPGYYQKVTSMSDLEDGIKVILVNEGYGEAVKQLDGKLLVMSGITVSGNTIAKTADLQEFIINIENNKVSFKFDNQYLDSTKAKEMSSSSSEVLWSISFYSGNVIITMNNSVGSLQYNYNSGNSRITTYTSSQQSIQLYKYVAGSITKVENIDLLNDSDYDNLWEVVHCTVCTEETSRVKHENHTLTTRNENVVPATCEAAGSYDLVTYCTVCGKVISTESQVIEKLAHTLVNHPETNDYYEYWQCSECKKYFEDAAGNNETTLEAMAKLHIHTMEEHAAVSAGCETAGNVAYWYCTGCKKYYSDENGNNELSSVVIPATGHNLNHHEADSTHYEYWQCSSCQKYFSDSEGNTEIAEDDTLKPTDITDLLNLAFTGVSGTNYSNWSEKVDQSGAVYAGNSAGGNSSIQLRSNNNNSGIVTTTSGGKVTKISVEWNSNTDSARTIDIYGKNSAYSSATDLYNSNSQGAKIGSIKCDTTELIITGDYEYIGIRSNSGALYLTSVSITWAISESSASEPISVTGVSIEQENQNMTVGDEPLQLTATVFPENATNKNVTWSSSNTNVATVDANGKVTAVAAGTTTITVTTDDGNKSSSIEINVSESVSSSKTVTFNVNDYSGQGTSGKGSSISVTKDDVTISNDKGYGTTQIRMYSGSTITISASNGKTITEIKFTFSGSYTGGLETSYTDLSTNSWNQTLSSQARITGITVVYQ